MKSITKLLAIFALSIAGCGSDASSTGSPPSSGKAAQSTAAAGSSPSKSQSMGAAAASAAPVASSEIPAPEDYEARAETDITPSNADSQLSTLEKDIGK
jgi:hypothetical protein